MEHQYGKVAMGDELADIIFVKNIDNVIQNHIDQITLYKKALAGILIELQQKVFQYLQEIDNEDKLNRSR